MMTSNFIINPVRHKKLDGHTLLWDITLTYHFSSNGFPSNKCISLHIIIMNSCYAHLMVVVIVRVRLYCSPIVVDLMVVWRSIDSNG